MYDAINKGFKMANGEILTYINTDDFYESNKTIEIVVDNSKSIRVLILHMDIVHLS